MKYRPCFSVFSQALRIFASLLALCALSARGELILEYTFNGSGTSAASTGTDTTSAQFRDSLGDPANLHGAAGSGVSGQASDLAFDNTSATGMGSAGAGGIANAGDVSAVDGLSSFTLQGWFKTDSTVSVGNAARLFDNAYGGSGGFFLYGEGGALKLNVDGIATVASSASYGATEEWVFFAVSYDGTQTTNNVNFYIGSTSEAVSLVSTATLNAGTTALAATPFCVGNTPAYVRAFDGYLDDMRVFGSTSDSSGVLSLPELEVIRSVDAIPEPSTSAMWMGLGLGVAGVVMHRRHVFPRRK